MCLDFQETQLKDKPLSHKIPGRPCKFLRADIFSISSKNYPCLIDCHSKLPVIKHVEDLSADILRETCKIIFSEYVIPRKIVSDVGTNFVFEKFQDFCICLSMHLAVSSYNNQSNRQAKECIIFVKRTMKL